MLIKYGADYEAKSRYGDDALQTACLKGATRIFEFLTEHINYPPEKLANAHELMGATYFDEHNDIHMCLNFWRTAINIRESMGLLPKTPVVPPREAFRYQTEFSSLAELENIATDLDSVRMQTLIISERILGPYHRDTVFR